MTTPGTMTTQTNDARHPAATSRAASAAETAKADDLKQRHKNAKMALYATPEVAAAVGLLAALTLATLASGSPILVAAILFAIGLLFLWMTIRNGLHGVFVMLCFYLAIIVLIVTATMPGLRAMTLTVGGAGILLFSDLVRINFARRRDATVETEPLWNALGATAAVIAVSLVSVWLTTGLSSADQARSWLWVPLASAAVGVPLLVISAVGARRQKGESARRWIPGERQLPQPRVD